MNMTLLRIQPSTFRSNSEHDKVTLQSENSVIHLFNVSRFVIYYFIHSLYVITYCVSPTWLSDSISKGCQPEHQKTHLDISYWWVCNYSSLDGFINLFMLVKFIVYNFTFSIQDVICCRILEHIFGSTLCKVKVL